MARERIVKGTPKRGKLTRSQVRSAAKKVIQERSEREAMAATTQAHSAVSKSESSPKKD